MTHDPRTKEEIYEELRASLTGKISKLTNFTESSFNFVLTQAFSEEIRELEILSVVAELSGWIDYTGGPVTDEDLQDLGISDNITAREVSEVMEDDYLDEFVKIVGIKRLPGSRATGTVSFTTESGKTNIPEGTRVTTAPDSNGNTIDFLTTESAETSNGVTTVTDVQIQAVEVGSEYNVPANEIVRLADPPIGVSGVDNPEATTGGKEEESNEELRARAKGAVQASSEGGTVDGIKGYIRKNVEGVGQGDVIIDEFFEGNDGPGGNAPYADVIVDGGLDEEVENAIDFSRPTSIRHNLVRPQVIQIGLDTDLLGSNITTSEVKENIEDKLLNFGIGENFYNSEIIRSIMESSSNIISVDNLGAYIERVTNEPFTYTTGQSEYRLDFTYENVNGSITVIDSDNVSYNEGSDFEIQDKTGDGWPETLVWIGTTPDEGQQFFVDYDVVVPGSTAENDYYEVNSVRDETYKWNSSYQESFDYNTSTDLYELEYVPFDGSSITDNSGDTYTEGTDYEIIDNSGNGFDQTIDWTIGGSTPDNDERFTITYDQKVYHTEYDIVSSPQNEVTDSDGDTYSENTDYTIVDYTDVAEDDSIEWTTQPSTISQGDEFYFSYITEGNINVEDREKIDPGQITFTEV